jgi:hypothetical protein
MDNIQCQNKKIEFILCYGGELFYVTNTPLLIEPFSLSDRHLG